MSHLQELQKSLKERTEKELKENILPFWINHTIDEEYGGFYGKITNDLQIDKEAPKGSILCGRILWTYSYAYRMYKNEKYLTVAKRAYDYMLKYFWDKEYGGIYWMADYKGNPKDTKKQIYANAFAIYGLSEYYRASGEKESLEKAVAIFRLIEEHSYDAAYRGYFEAFTREWKLADDLRLSEKEMNEKKTMNTHLHVLEAYTNLFRVLKDEGLQGKLRELIEVTIDHIVDPVTHHFKLFFEENWISKGHIVSYGHDIEGSWLLLEAAEVLGEDELIERSKTIAVEMAEATLAEGLDADGGLLNEKHEDTGMIDRDKHWWPQAEAVVGFLNAYQLTGREDFFMASYKCWDFIENHIVDKKYGEWLWIAPAEANHYESYAKVDPWKCPYHNSRSCYEVIERVK